MNRASAARKLAAIVAIVSIASIAAACNSATPTVGPTGTPPPSADVSPSVPPSTVPSASDSGAPASPPPYSSPLPKGSPKGHSFAPGPDPSLEALIPKSVEGVPVVVTSLTGEQAQGDDTGCALLCGHEIDLYAKELGADESRVTVALGEVDDTLWSARIFAIRAPGGRTDGLEQAWWNADFGAADLRRAAASLAPGETVGVLPTPIPFQAVKGYFGEKTVYSYTGPDLRPTWLYAHDGVLYVIRVDMRQSGQIDYVQQAALVALALP